LEQHENGSQKQKAVLQEKQRPRPTPVLTPETTAFEVQPTKEPLGGGGHEYEKQDG
jgi:hypothetical protein